MSSASPSFRLVVVAMCAGNESQGSGVSSSTAMQPSRTGTLNWRVWGHAGFAGFVVCSTLGDKQTCLGGYVQKFSIFNLHVW